MPTDPEPSFADDQMKTLLDGVVDLMVQARCLKSCTDTKRERYRLVRTLVDAW